ncbi:MAG: hypothetical protein IPN75_03660 [Dechloromonas sp.]|uniref:Uncharacterized protein n=1 Tax=Candidatus Dechloromonas phosphorivorans TaxID=2899244 RepID=A0A9D7LP57_9RHOO|nr:hypothetical protein [Candidatus Dechloromonas phosphorivorans]
MVTKAGFRARQVDSYQTLASHGSGLRFAKVGATLADWRKAFSARDLAALMTTIIWFRDRRVMSIARWLQAFLFLLALAAAAWRAPTPEAPAFTDTRAIGN